MKLIKKEDGSINVNATLETLQAGDNIVLKEDQIKVDYLRTQAAKIGRKNNWVIKVGNSRDLKGKVIITRIS